MDEMSLTIEFARAVQQATFKAILANLKATPDRIEAIRQVRKDYRDASTFAEDKEHLEETTLYYRRTVERYLPDLLEDLEAILALKEEHHT